MNEKLLIQLARQLPNLREEEVARPAIGSASIQTYKLELALLAEKGNKIFMPPLKLNDYCNLNILLAIYHKTSLR